MTVNLANYVGMEVTSTFKNGYKATGKVRCLDKKPDSRGRYTFNGSDYNSSGWILGGTDSLDIVDVQVNCRKDKQVSVRDETTYLLSLNKEQAELILKLMANELVRLQKTSILYKAYRELKNQVGVMN